MDRERLTRLLEEPGKVAREDLADLKELTEKFPWFSAAHLLRAVGEQAGGDVLADEVLHQSAAHVPSRAVLFDLTDQSLSEAAEQLKHASSLKVIEKEVSRNHRETPIVVPSIEKQDELPEEVIEERTDAQPVSEDSAPSVEGDPIGSKSDELIRTEEEEFDQRIEVEAPTDIQKPEAEPAVDEELDRQIIEAALASAYDLTLDMGVEARVIPRTPDPPADNKEPVALQTAEPPINSGSESVQKTADVEPAPKKITVGSRLRFTDWLVAGTEESGPPKTTSPKTDPHVSTDQPSSQAPVIEKPSPEALTPVDPKTLIDRFIQHETPQPVRKAEFYTPQQAAKKSLDDSVGLVSETLARIYEKQGNIPKAIEAYQKLALKYPEKSAYFAALSKSLEGRSNV